MQKQKQQKVAPPQLRPELLEAGKWVAWRFHPDKGWQQWYEDRWISVFDEDIGLTAPGRAPGDLVLDYDTTKDEPQW